jgi:hypothetical protein
MLVKADTEITIFLQILQLQIFGNTIGPGAKRQA